jgi:hypothetical protein
MISQIIRKLQQLETLMVPPDDRLKFRIEVVFINPAGEVTGTRILSSQTSEETSEDRLHD